jgi:hypothetical protein
MQHGMWKRNHFRPIGFEPAGVTTGPLGILTGSVFRTTEDLPSNLCMFSFQSPESKGRPWDLPRSTRTDIEGLFVPPTQTDLLASGCPSLSMKTQHPTLLLPMIQIGKRRDAPSYIVL